MRSCKARDLNGEDGNVIAVIGDGSLSGGEALEGLDYAAELGGNLIIVVNDNDMSIAENHGGIYQNLKLLRETNGQAECNLFCAMGLDYIYVDHGNDVAELIQAFASVKDSKKAIVVHINTLKGKGYAPAEQHKEQWHFNGPFILRLGSLCMKWKKRLLRCDVQLSHEEDERRSGSCCHYFRDSDSSGIYRG